MAKGAKPSSWRAASSSASAARASPLTRRRLVRRQAGAALERLPCERDHAERVPEAGRTSPPAGRLGLEGGPGARQEVGQLDRGLDVVALGRGAEPADRLVAHRAWSTRCARCGSPRLACHASRASSSAESGRGSVRSCHHLAEVLVVELLEVPRAEAVHGLAQPPSAARLSQGSGDSRVPEHHNMTPMRYTASAWPRLASSSSRRLTAAHVPSTGAREDDAQTGTWRSASGTARPASTARVYQWRTASAITRPASIASGAGGSSVSCARWNSASASAASPWPWTAARSSQPRPR